MTTPLETAYKLGSFQAANDFEAAMRNAEYDNPTQAPPKAAGFEIDTDGVVKRVREKMSARNEPSRPRASRTPTGNGGRFAALKKKLIKHKGRK